MVLEFPIMTKDLLLVPSNKTIEEPDQVHAITAGQS
jgi:hypothetical protein